MSNYVCGKYKVNPQQYICNTSWFKCGSLIDSLNLNSRKSDDDDDVIYAPELLHRQ